MDVFQRRSAQKNPFSTMPSNQEEGASDGACCSPITEWSQSQAGQFFSCPSLYHNTTQPYVLPSSEEVGGLQSNDPADNMRSLPNHLPLSTHTEERDLPRRLYPISGFPSNQGRRTDQMTSTSGGVEEGAILCEESPPGTLLSFSGDNTGTSSSGESSQEGGNNSSTAGGSNWNNRTTCIKNGRRTIKPREDPDILDPTRRMRRRELSQFNAEEAERIVRRRERNKVAATKCRHKRREQHEELVKELQSMECNNTTLTYEIRQLQRERQALSDLLRHHQMSCSANQLMSTTDTGHHGLDTDSLTSTAGNMPGPYPLPYSR